MRKVLSELAAKRLIIKYDQYYAAGILIAGWLGRPLHARPRFLATRWLHTHFPECSSAREIPLVSLGSTANSTEQVVMNQKEKSWTMNFEALEYVLKGICNYNLLTNSVLCYDFINSAEYVGPQSNMCLQLTVI
ncbi:hypothetical protein ACTXT7_006636 [Hymenolepis weldensis]